MTKLRSLWETFFSFGAIQVALIFLPLLALPYLARVLQPDAFGQLMYQLTLALVVGMFVEWGFTLGAVRGIAMERDNPQRLHQTVQGVLSAKVLLAVIVAGVLSLLKYLFPTIGGDVHGFIYGGCYGIILGINPTWYYQGIGKGMRTMALWDVGSSTIVLALTFLIIHQPEDGYIYLLLLSVCKGTCYVWLNIRIYKKYSPLVLSFQSAVKALLHVKAFFFARLATTLSAQGNTVILGNILIPSALGMLVAADKIARAVVSINGPVIQTLFPEVCALQKKELQTVRTYLRISLLGSALFGIITAAILSNYAPYITYIALGTQYTEAVPLLRIVCFVIPLLACNIVLATQILIPFGYETVLVRIFLIIGITSLPVVTIIGYSLGVTGAAYMPILIEGAIFCALAYCVYIKCPEALLCPTHVK